MANLKTISLIVLIFLLVITIVVFALSIVILIDVQKLDNSRDQTTTAAPTSPTTTTAAPTGPTTTTGTGTPPTTKAQTNPNFYRAQFTDESRMWKKEYADPNSQDYKNDINYYNGEIYQVLSSYNYTVYGNSIVTVTTLAGEYLDTVPISNGTNVQFTIQIDGMLDITTFEADLEAAAAKSGLKWREIDTNSAEIPKLPAAGTSHGWYQAANMFLTSLNTSVDPCVDFFAYSCDNYIASHPLGNASAQSTFDELQTNINRNLTAAFEDLYANINTQQSEALKLAANVYRACIVANETDYTGGQQLIGIIDAYGGWPILRSAWTYADVPHGFASILGDMFTRYGVASLLTPTIDIDVTNITRQMLYLDQASLVINSAYYNSPNLTQQYQDKFAGFILVTVFTLNNVSGGPPLNMTQVQSDIDAMVQIEVDLASIMVGSDDQRNQSLGYNLYTIDTAETEFPNLEFENFLTSLVNPVFPQDDVRALLDPFVIKEPRKYVTALNKYIGDCKADPAKMRDLINYLVFRAVYGYMTFSGPLLEEIVNEFQRELDNGFSFGLKKTMPRGVDDITPRQTQCVSALTQLYPWATGRVYVDNSFPAENRDDVAVMINNVLSAFSSSLSGLQWMDNPSALNAFTKVAGLVRNVAYPDFVEDNAQLDAYYKPLTDNVQSLHIDPETTTDALFQYVIQLVQFQTHWTIKNLKMESNRAWFLMSPAVVNAWYQPQRNSITFPAAILNPPFYHYDFPFAVNYGALGVVMGHELSHGFDDEGVQFDWDGSLHTWMTPHAEAGFQNMAQCVVDEYSGFCYDNDQTHAGTICIDGTHTQGENIGDNGGLKAAFRAYKAYVASHGEEPRLPGMEQFTMEQVFFLAYGQVWCGSYSPDALTKQLLTNEHSPGRDRVIGAVQNFPEFANAFKCKLGDPMYPKNACDVW